MSKDKISLRRGTVFGDVKMFRHGGLIEEEIEEEIDVTTKLLGSSQNLGLGLDNNKKDRTLSESSAYSNKSKNV